MQFAFSKIKELARALSQLGCPWRKVTPWLSETAMAVLVGTVLAGCTTSASRPETAQPILTRTFPLPGVTGTRTNVGVPGRLDHLAYDPATQRLFVAALENGSLEVLDLNSGAPVRSIGGLSRPQGAAVVPGASCVAVACGGDGTLQVFDTRTLERLRTMEIGDDADNVRYDQAAHTILVSYGTTNAGAIAVLDAQTWAKMRDIPFASRPESFQLAPDGVRVFANLPRGARATTDGEVAVTDRVTGATVKLIRLPGKAGNFPMAFDAQHERLFIACRRPSKLVVIDTRRNEVIAEAPCTDDSDDLFYDATHGVVLVIGGGFRPDLQTAAERSPCSPPGSMGALDVFRVGADGALQRLETQPTAPHARTGLWVPARRALYVVVPMQPGADPEVREYLVN